MGIEDICDFGFMDPPKPDHVRYSLRRLRDLGALAGEDFKVTDLGRKMAEFPLAPHLVIPSGTPFSTRDAHNLSCLAVEGPDRGLGDGVFGGSSHHCVDALCQVRLLQTEKLTARGGPQEERVRRPAGHFRCPLAVAPAFGPDFLLV
jgi:hypothetical protein